MLLKLSLRLFLVAQIFLCYLTVSAKPGFTSITDSHFDPQIPTAVQNARHSIFKIVFPLYMTLKTPEAEGFLTATHLKDEGRRTIQECVSRKTALCVFPIVTIEGSAFRDRSHDSIWTNCHLIDGWIRFQKQAARWSGSDLPSRLQSQALSAKVFDSTGTLLENNLALYVEAVHADSGMEPESGGCNMFDDAVRLRGFQTDRPVLPWAPYRPAGSFEPESTYVGGFPRSTSSRQPLGASDSDGSQFYWTQGGLLSVQDIEQILASEKKDPQSYAMIVRGAYTVILSNDGAEGMSGGPILNKDGEILGIFKGLLPGPAGRAWPLATVGISTGGLRYLEIRSGL